MRLAPFFLALQNLFHQSFSEERENDLILYIEKNFFCIRYCTIRNGSRNPSKSEIEGERERERERERESYLWQQSQMFFSINSYILLNKLAHYGTRNRSNRWFHAYLTHRVHIWVAVQRIHQNSKKW